MIYFCDAGGVIFSTVPERVFQGSMGVNKIRFVGQFPASAMVLVSYTLPDGTPTTPQLMTNIGTLEEVQGVNGGKYSVWECLIGATPKLDGEGNVVLDDNGNVTYNLINTITEYPGTVTIQFSVYGSNGGILATASSSFVVEKGSPAIIPDFDSDDKLLLQEILQIVSATKEAVDDKINKYGDTVTGYLEFKSGSAAEKTVLRAGSVALELSGNDYVTYQRAGIVCTRNGKQVVVTFPTESGQIATTGEVSRLNNDILAIEADVEGLRKDMQNEAHFRGYVASNADFTTLYGNANDFAYSSESGTVWIYHENEGWKDSGVEVPSQLVSGSNATPLMDGEADAGTDNKYARGDHRHPSDETKVSISVVGEANGVASLDETGKVPQEQLPETSFNADEVLKDYVKFTDTASQSKTGVVKVFDGSHGLTMVSGGILCIKATTENMFKNRATSGSSTYQPLTLRAMDKGVLYALAKCDDTSIWTEDDKAAARELLGAKVYRYNVQFTVPDAANYSFTFVSRNANISTFMEVAADILVGDYTSALCVNTDTDEPVTMNVYLQDGQVTGSVDFQPISSVFISSINKKEI